MPVKVSMNRGAPATFGGVVGGSDVLPDRRQPPNDDDQHGRSGRPVCGASSRLFYFAGRPFDDVPPAWRCRDCGVRGR